MEIVAACVVFNISDIKLNYMSNKLWRPAQLDIEDHRPPRTADGAGPMSFAMLLAVNAAADRVKDGTIRAPAENRPLGKAPL
jgi:hypothetical protein